MRLQFGTLLFMTFLVSSLTNASSIEGTGFLPGGTNTATATGLSPDGLVAIGYSSGANGFEAYRWTSGTGIQGLGDLPGGGFSSYAMGSSFDGSKIVGRGTPSITRGFQWTSAGMVQLPELAGTSSTSHEATAISYDGRVIVGQSNSLPFGIRATQWTDFGLGTVLPDLAGGSIFSKALGISGNGRVVAGWSSSANGFEACRWVDGNIEALGDFPGGPFDSHANAASYDGRVVVGRGWNADGATAFVWTEGSGLSTIGNTTIGQPAFNSEAFAVSESGQFVVGRGNFTDSGGFFWTPEMGMRSLKQILLQTGANVTGWSQINEAVGISADGCTIAGNGISTAGIMGYVIRLNSFSGTATLQDFAGDVNGERLNIDVVSGPSPLSVYTRVKLGAGGTFRVPALAQGTFALAFKGSHWLRRLVSGIVSPSASSISVSLVNGDVDGDNEITLTDYSLLATSFGSTPGDPNWNANADLDGDGEVVLSDYSILSRNFGQSGD